MTGSWVEKKKQLEGSVLLMFKRWTPLFVLILLVLVASSTAAQELKNLTSGLSYQVSPNGDPFYENFPESKYSPKLTDGQTLPKGETHNTGYPWLMAFRRPGAKGVAGGVIFDLKETKEIRQVNVSVYANHMAAYSFYNPDEIAIRVSDDGEAWQEALVWTNPLSRSEHPTGSQWVVIPLNEPMKARYVEVFFSAGDGTSIIFLDEIAVLGL